MCNICRYIVSSIALACFAGLVQAQPQVQAQPVVAADSVAAPVPLWQGFELEADVLPLITNLLNDGSTFRYEALARINLMKKYFPVVEVGYESLHRKMHSGTEFTGAGLFYRLGIDFNLIKPVNNKPVKNKFLVGARIGFTDFEYDVQNLIVRDEYLKETRKEDFYELRNSSLWYEIVAGIRIEVVKNLSIGWSVRIKNQITQPEAGVIQPLSIPGYGQSGGNVWALNYMLGYKF